MDSTSQTTPSATARYVLLVEDEATVACDLHRFLGGAGYHVVGPVASLADALSKIAGGKVDGAVLDVTLEGGNAEQVADALDQANIPHIFINGWAIGPACAECRHRPLLNNPYDYHSLLDALDRAFGDKRPSTSQ